MVYYKKPYDLCDLPVCPEGQSRNKETDNKCTANCPTDKGFVVKEVVEYDTKFKHCQCDDGKIYNKE